MISYSFLKYLFWSFLTNTKKKLKRGNNSPRCFVSRDLIVAVKFICIHVFSSYLLLVALIRIIQEHIFLRSSAVITVTFFKYMIFSFLLCLLKFKIFRHGVVFFFVVIYSCHYYWTSFPLCDQHGKMISREELELLMEKEKTEQVHVRKY
jgi:hypothetical protein